MSGATPRRMKIDAWKPDAPAKEHYPKRSMANFGIAPSHVPGELWIVFLRWRVRLPARGDFRRKTRRNTEGL